jgi:hypothetical protein
MVPYLTVDSPADIRPKCEPRGSRGSIILRTAAVEYPFLHRHTYDGDASVFFGGFIDFGIAVFVSSCCRLWRRTLFDRVCFSQRSPLHQKCTQSCQTICEVLRLSWCRSKMGRAAIRYSLARSTDFSARSAQSSATTISPLPWRRQACRPVP